MGNVIRLVKIGVAKMPIVTCAVVIYKDGNNIKCRRVQINEESYLKNLSPPQWQRWFEYAQFPITELISVRVLKQFDAHFDGRAYQARLKVIAGE